MPEFNYKATPSLIISHVTAVDGIDAASIVGAGNFDATYGFVEISTDHGQQAVAINPQSTTWISGGEITPASATTINIAAGFGQIVDYSDPLNPATTPVPFGPFTNVAITDIATTLDTKILIDVVASIPTVSQQLSEINPALARSMVQLGFVIHPAGAITDTLNIPIVSREPAQQLVDYMNCLKVANCGGLSLSPNADLTFSKSAGEIAFPGAGINSGDVRENVAIINAANPQAFETLLGIQNVIPNPSTTLIDVGFWDDGSATKTAIPGPPATATILYVYQVPSQNLGVTVMYGQTLYDTLADAIANQSVDVIELPQLLIDTALLIGRIAVRRDATDLSDPDQAFILPGAKFGTTITGGSSGGGGGGGDVFGPATAIPGNVPSLDATGKILTDSGIASSEIVTGPSSSGVDIVGTFSTTGGKNIKSTSDCTLLSGELRRSTANGDLTLKQNGSGIVAVEGDANAGTLQINTINPAANSVLSLLNSGTVSASFTEVIGSGGYVIQSGTGTGIPPDASTPYIYHQGSGRFEIASGRLEQRVVAGNVQYLMVVNGTNRAGFSFIESSNSFNIRVGANPDPTGFDIFVDQTQLNHPVTPKSYTTVERDALTIGNISDGAIIYNSDVGRLQEKIGAGWRSIFSPEGAIFRVWGNLTPTIIGGLGSYTPITFGGGSVISGSSDFTKALDTTVEYVGSSFIGILNVQFDWRVDAPLVTDTYSHDVVCFVGGAQVTNSGYSNINSNHDGDLMSGTFSCPVTLTNSSSIQIRIRQNAGTLKNVVFNNISMTFDRTE